MSARRYVAVVVLGGVVALGSANCAAIAIAVAPTREGKLADTPKKRDAVAAFWAASHAGAYDDLPHVIDALAGAYIEHPNDPELAKLLGGAYTWQLAEVGRAENHGAGPTLNALFAGEAYWADARELAPNDPLANAFYGQSLLVRGVIFKDEKITRTGYFTLKAAADRFPAVDSFVLGLALARSPHGDARLDDAEAALWKTLEQLVGTVNHKEPDMRPLLAKESHTGDARFLWGSEKVPHPFEGFFSFFGDVMVKKGNADLADRLYAQAKLAPRYAQWPYKDALERQIATSHERAKSYPSGDLKPDAEEAYMPSLARLCSRCHEGQ